jgi:hypothetical protein
MSELPDTAPPCVHDEGSKRLVLSGLNHTTFDLTVYASQDGSPHHHARLASGCWSSFARRDSYPQDFSERFQSSSLFLLPKAYLTQGHHTYFGGIRDGVPGTESISVTNEVRVELYHQAQYSQCVTIIDLRTLIP